VVSWYILCKLQLFRFKFKLEWLVLWWDYGLGCGFLIGNFVWLRFCNISYYNFVWWLDFVIYHIMITFGIMFLVWIIETLTISYLKLMHWFACYLSLNTSLYNLGYIMRCKSCLCV
jgi:hypothetical protein